MNMPLEPIRSDALDPLGRGYPRPQLQREHWYSLNGEWEFALDPLADCRDPEAVAWRTRITVPFSPETPASGVHDTSFYRACWYRRRCEIPPAALGSERTDAPARPAQTIVTAEPNRTGGVEPEAAQPT